MVKLAGLGADCGSTWHRCHSAETLCAVRSRVGRPPLERRPVALGDLVAGRLCLARHKAPRADAATVTRPAEAPPCHAPSFRLPAHEILHGWATPKTGAASTYAPVRRR
jgi:hypothetical protein